MKTMNTERKTYSFGKRVASLALALAMVFTTTGTAVYAEDLTTSSPVSEATSAASEEETLAVEEATPAASEAASAPTVGTAPADEESPAAPVAEDPTEERAAAFSLERESSVALQDIALDGNAQFSVTKFNGAAFDESSPVKVGDTVLIKLDYEIANTEKNLLDGDTVIRYTFPAGFDVPTTDWMGMQGGAGMRRVTKQADGSYLLEFKLTQDFLDANSDISGNFTWNAKLQEVQTSDRGEATYDFGGDSNSITLYFDSEVTGGKGYEKTEDGYPVLDADGYVTFTAALHLDRGSRNVSISDSLGASFSFLDPTAFTMQGPDGATQAVPMTLADANRTASAVLGDLAAGDYTFTYKAKLEQANGSDADNTNTFTWKWNDKHTDKAEVTVVTGGELDVPLHFAGTKKLRGDNLKAGEFTLQLVEYTGGTPVVVAETTNNADGSYTLGYTLKNAQAGTYLYWLCEKDESATNPNISYDTTKHLVQVEVTEDKAGKKSYTAKVLDNGVERPLNAQGVYAALNFTNVNTKPETEVTLEGTKTVNNAQPQNQSFGFALYEVKDGVQTKVGEAESDANTGKFTFPRQTYTAEGTYTYQVKENIPAESERVEGIVYDETVHTVVVTVTKDENGALTAATTVDGNADSALTFNNKNTTVNLPLTGSKTLRNGSLQDGQFNFLVKDSTGMVVAEGTNNAAGEITIDGLHYTAPGTYTYTVEEENGGTIDANGVRIDATKYDLTVTVTKAEDGSLTASRTLKKQGETTESALTFANVGSTGNDATITGTKTVNNQTPGEAGLDDTEFVFRMAEWDNPGRSWSSNSSYCSYDKSTGVFTIKKEVVGSDSQLHITKPGDYAYRVFEVAGSAPGVTYDTTAYKLVLTVAYDADDKLAVTGQTAYRIGAGDSLIPVEGITFNNDFDPSKVPPKTSLDKKVLATRMDGSIDWQSTIDLSGLKDGQKLGNLVYTDKIADANAWINGGNVIFPSTIDETSITVQNGTATLVAGTDYTVAMDTPANGFTLAFAGEFSACKLVVSYTSQTTNLDKIGANEASITVNNAAASSYTYGGTTYTDEDTDHGTFGKIFSKEDSYGDAVRYDEALKAYVITWTIQLNIGHYDLGEQKFTILDTLPDGLAYIPGTTQYREAFWTDKEPVRTEPTEREDGTLAWEDLTTHGTTTMWLRFDTKVTDELLTTVNGGTLTVENRAGLESGGVNLGEDTGKANVNLQDGFVSKNGAQVDAMDQDGKHYAAGVAYTVKINPRAMDLLQNSDVLTLVDTHSANASLDVDSVRVYLGDTEETLDEYGLDYDIDETTGEGKLTLTVPDATYLRLCYTLEPTDLFGEETTITNHANLSGHEAWGGETEDKFVVETTKDSITGKQGVLTLRKYDKVFQSGKPVTLSGVGFALYKVDLAASAAAGEVVAAPYTTGTTGPDGMLQFGLTESLPLDTLFYYVETEAKPGYKLDTEPHYVVLAGNSYNSCLDKISACAPLAGVTVTNGAMRAVKVYNEKLSLDLDLAAVKTVNGKTPTADQVYDFTLADAEGNLLQTKQNAGSAITFDALHYTADDIGKTYTYQVAEQAGTDTALTYDATVYTVRVTIGLGEDALTAEVTVNDAPYTEGALAFANRTANSIEFTLGAHKALEGADLAADEFSFELLDSTGKLLQTATNDAAGLVTFAPLVYDAAGTTVYTIREAAGTESNITYDTTVYTATVTVTEAGGKLSAAVAYTQAGAAVAAAKFTNTYTATATELALAAHKTLTGAALKADTFSFTLQDDATGEVLQTKQNAADGTVAFDAIEYTAVGTTSYTIREVDGGLNGIAYDTAAYTATVTVTDVDGALNAAVVYTKDGATVDAAEFVNTQLETDTQLTGTKYFFGVGGLTAGKFRFTLTAADENGAARTGTALEKAADGKLYDDGTGAYTETVYNAASTDGMTAAFTFGKISYRAAGSYYYLITEDQDFGTAPNLSMDPSEYLVKVEVEQADGALTATRTMSWRYDNGDEVLTDDSATSADFFNNEMMLMSMSRAFVNITGKKTLTDNGVAVPMQAGQFRFDLHSDAADGPIVATATNDADGNFTFAMSISRAGTYTYYATEQNGGATIDGITYDANAYPVTVTVADDPELGLAATVAGELVFANTASTYVKVQKLWADPDHEEARPAAITVALYQNGATDTARKTAELTAEGGWTYEFTGLPSRDAEGNTIVYSVGEAPVPGYTAEIAQNAADDHAFTITNTYDEAANAFFTPAVTKTLAGRAGIPMTAGEFSFALTDAAGNTLATVVNDAAGKVAFPTMSYAEEGTTEYTITEVAGSDAHIVYDTTKMKLTVTVAKNAETGLLEATGSYTDAETGAAVTGFTNTYRPVVVRVRKTSRDGSGDPLLNACYGLWMVNEGGADVYIGNALSDAEGYMVFKTIVPGARYYFKEESAPNGHTVDEYKSDIFSVVEKDGTFALVYEGSGTGTGHGKPAAATEILTDTDAVAAYMAGAVAQSNEPIILDARGVSDEVTKLTVSKLDKNTHENLSGAVMQIIDKATGTVMVEWTTDGTAKAIDRTLNVDTRYILHEAMAPRGYALAADTEFTLDAYGNMTVHSGTDAEWVGDTTLNLYDAKLATTIIHTKNEDKIETVDRYEQQTGSKTATTTVTNNTVTRVAHNLPQTGDETPFGLILLAMLDSLLALVYLSLRKRNRNRK